MERQRSGAASEMAAEKALLGAGYVVIERNWLGGGGEIDRIAMDGEVLVFVEIRSRSTSKGARPLAGITKRKRIKVARAGLAYLARLRPRGLPACRFDVVSVLWSASPSPEVTIVRGAFDVEDFSVSTGTPWI